jgi:hypothetical protein
MLIEHNVNIIADSMDFRDFAAASERIMAMITTLATLLFTATMATALLSLAWDLTRPLCDPYANDAELRARAEARRIAALPRTARTFGRAARPVVTRLPVVKPAAVIRRPSLPALAAAA